MRGFEIVSDFEGKDIHLPVRKTAKSAGYDIEAGEDSYLMPGERILVKTGLKAYMEDDEFLDLRVRSGLAFKSGLFLCNGSGVIDADYYNNEDNEGHIQVALYNASRLSVPINKGDRIAQGIFQKYYKVEEEETVTTERVSGFGSTDTKYPINKKKAKVVE